MQGSGSQNLTWEHLESSGATGRPCISLCLDDWSWHKNDCLIEVQCHRPPLHLPGTHTLSQGPTLRRALKIPKCLQCTLPALPTSRLCPLHGSLAPQALAGHLPSVCTRLPLSVPPDSYALTQSAPATVTANLTCSSGKGQSPYSNAKDTPVSRAKEEPARARVGRLLKPSPAPHSSALFGPVLEG